jgi:3,4-dihydroxy 2-butanone 4-phosphate synthase/GTP cyclohydrolase II
MEGPDLDRLALPQMITSAENDESMYTAFAVTVDLRAGTSTGRWRTGGGHGWLLASCW